jgi:hypothetical protein
VNDTVSTETDNPGTGGDTASTRRPEPPCRRHAGPESRSTALVGAELLTELADQADRLSPLASLYRRLAGFFGVSLVDIAPSFNRVFPCGSTAASSSKV